jgi:hypothetical protein
MDFILMLTRNDRTVEDAEELLDDVLACGVGHVGFKDIGVPAPVMRRLVERIRQARAVSYLEVVSTTPQAVERSLSAARDLGVDRVLGGTDLDAASRLLGDLARYHPFPGRPVGHPTALAGSPALVAEHCREARRRRRARWRPPDRRRQRQLGRTHQRAVERRRSCLHDRLSRVRRLFLAEQGWPAQPDPRHARRLQAAEAGCHLTGRASELSSDRRPTAAPRWTAARRASPR